MHPTPTTPSKNRITWIRTAALASAVAALALVAPVIWLAVSGGIGLLVLGTLLAVAFAAVQVFGKCRDHGGVLQAIAGLRFRCDRLGNQHTFGHICRVA